MRVADLQVMFDYNYWANDRLLKAAAPIRPEEFTAETRFPYGSLRGALVHILHGERRYLAACQGKGFTGSRPEDFPDVASLIEQWRRDEAEMRAYLATVSEDDLDQPVTVTFPGLGVSSTESRWKFLLHAVNHGTQHRSDAAQMLTELGHSPGNLDLVFVFPMTPLPPPE